MLNTQAFDQISDIITAEDFYRADHRVILTLSRRCTSGVSLRT